MTNTTENKTARVLEDTRVRSNAESNPFDDLIKNADTDARRGVSRQAMFTTALYTSPHHSKAEIVRMWKLKGADRTAQFQSHLSDLSPFFAERVAELSRLNNLRQDERDADHGAQVEACKRTIKAAQEMYVRAVKALYGIHEKVVLPDDLRAKAKITGVEYIKPKAGGVGGLRIWFEDKDGRAREDVSNAVATSKGAKALTEAIGGKPAQAQRNTEADIVKNSCKALSAVLNKRASMGKRIPVTDDPAETDIGPVFVELFAMFFADDDGRIDRKTLEEYAVMCEKRIAEINATIKSQIAASNKAQKKAA